MMCTRRYLYAWVMVTAGMSLPAWDRKRVRLQIHCLALLLMAVHRVLDSH